MWRHDWRKSDNGMYVCIKCHNKSDVMHLGASCPLKRGYDKTRGY